MGAQDGGGDGQPEDGFKRLTPATLVPLLRARPPHKDLGAFLRLSRDSLQRVSLHDDGPLHSFVRFAIRTAARGPLATIDVEMLAVPFLEELSAEELTEVRHRLLAAWPTATGGRRRVLERVQAMLELAHLHESSDLAVAVSEATTRMVVVALEYQRPPTWVDDFQQGLPALRPRPDRASFVEQLALIQAKAPTAWALCHADLAAMARLLPEEGAESLAAEDAESLAAEDAEDAEDTGP